MKFSLAAALALCTVPEALTQGTSKAFPPGWNGEAKQPPMGWRSWNAFGANIKNETIVAAIDALTARVWNVRGHSGKVSLFDVGYKRLGIDEGWENCSGSDPNHGLRQHDEDGFPMVNTDKFPDLKWIVDYGHAKDLVMGWYLNGCACGERKEREVNYKGDVQRLHEYGFDAVKLDGCGAATNMTKYAEYMQATGRTYAIENCHWGHCGTDSWYKNPDGSSCPTAAWAPFNWFRTSGDINSSPMSWFNNLQTTIKFQDYNAPLAKPGVWAYPDMLEVGRVKEPVNGSFYTWNRAHFGAWCVTSSPLILGMDLTDPGLARVVDVITNAEAIQINQQWSGHPGMLVENILPKQTAGNGHGDENAGQLWAKRQADGAMAAFVVNHSPKPLQAYSLELSKLNLTEATYTVRDVWTHTDNGTATGHFVMTIPAYDSVFLLLTPSPKSLLI